MENTTATATWQTIASAPVGSRILVPYFGADGVRMNLWTNEAAARRNENGYEWGVKIDKVDRHHRIEMPDGRIIEGSGGIRVLVQS